MNTNKDAITRILQEILTESPQFFCFTDHSQLNILAWKSKKASNAFILKIGDKRFFASPRTDRQGREYWKFHPLTAEQTLTEKEVPLSANQATIKEQTRTPDSFCSSETKFSSEKGLGESEAVKKFQAKYGNPNQSKETAQ